MPLTQVKLSINEIDSEIIVFDGGNESTPPIRPPDDIRWRSIPIRHLHIEDELRGRIQGQKNKYNRIRRDFRRPSVNGFTQQPTKLTRVDECKREQSCVVRRQFRPQ